MQAAIDPVTKLIQSPPGVLVAGAALAGIVWKFFDRVEVTANKDRRLKVTEWLSNVTIMPSDKPSVRLVVFWSACGASSSRKRLILVAILTMVNDLLSGISIGAKYSGAFKASVETLYFVFTFALIAIVLDANERFLSRTFRVRAVLASMFALALSVAMGLTALILVAGISLSRALSSPNLIVVALRLAFVPALTANIWMWLPRVSGFVFIAATRLDAFRRWFNSNADVRDKPFQSIGFVAGILVALMYWTVAFLGRFVKI